MGTLTLRHGAEGGLARRSGSYVETVEWGIPSDRLDDERSAALRAVADGVERGYVEADGVIEPGLLTAEEFMAVHDLIAARRRDAFLAIQRANREAEASVPSEIIATATQLGLAPEPSGAGRDAWTARCPGTHHWIGLQPSTERFFCDYCRCSGDVEQLRRLALQRSHDRSNVAAAWRGDDARRDRWTAGSKLSDD